MKKKSTAFQFHFLCTYFYINIQTLPTLPGLELINILSAVGWQHFKG